MENIVSFCQSVLCVKRDLQLEIMGRVQKIYSYGRMMRVKWNRLDAIMSYLNSWQHFGLVTSVWMNLLRLRLVIEHWEQGWYDELILPSEAWRDILATPIPISYKPSALDLEPRLCSIKLLVIKTITIIIMILIIIIIIIIISVHLLLNKLWV